MSTPWEQPWFGEAYDLLCEPDGSAGHTEEEVAYLCEVLGQQGRGRRVIDLGCGTGRHAVGLARAGFEVVGVDRSAWAIGLAERRSAAAGVEVCWRLVDFLAVGPWPFAQADAVICVDSLGWGSDAGHRRLLRRLRRHLAPSGILILAGADPFWQAQRSPTTVTRVVAQVAYGLQQAYDPGTGRLRGTVTVSASAVADRSCPFDLRLYSPCELKSLIRQAGFLVERLDTDFNPRGPDTAVPRTRQFVARLLPTPPAALAVATWRTPSEPGLELRYAPDETPWLAPSPAEIWRDLLRSEADLGANAAGFYAVDDPYGAERGAEVAAAYFGCPVPPGRLTFGAGVTALLRDLSGLAEGGLVLAPELTHPDVEAWTVAAGGEVHHSAEPLTPGRLMTAIDELRPTLVHLDRPTATGELCGLADLETVCRAASRAGAIVLVDESPASCLGPARSGARLIHEVDNLVVLRGLTKAYSCPGLRVGFALASEVIAPRIRELVAPLQVSELSFRAALRLLAAGDVFARFRARVAAVKPTVAALLEASGFEVIRGHPELPWVLVRDPRRTASVRIRRLGIRGLRPVPSPTQCDKVPEFLHLSLPLSDERLAALTGCLRGESQGPARSPRSHRRPVR